jgi:hypothetical protein
MEIEVPRRNDGSRRAVDSKRREPNGLPQLLRRWSHAGDRSRCEQCSGREHMHGQIRARFRLGHAQNAVAVQGPAGGQNRSNRKREGHQPQLFVVWEYVRTPRRQRFGRCDCGESHDRDVNAAKNILRRTELSASMYGNGLSTLQVPPSRASRSPKAGIRTARTMASAPCL